MDANLKAKWVEALRSGEYKQARNALRDGNRYCCLGVLCKVAGLPIRNDGLGVEGHGVGGKSSYSSYEPIFNLVGGFDQSHPLSMRNDGAGNFKPHTFKQIADYIEANL
ncbi:hypothetical protein [Bradyrhizobium sp. 930_D9_N1_4]|uniref:hypothetical protein n=1 Tax=Bradyrhizobium sp. 930_D9_N1_4 TaxID=3240374 RepID=UPI003F8B13A6